ncbi:phosphopantothenoylcysteine decarboxylase [Candidatus Uhrbacteria bacterium]|nr:phosphopantothenoylcysteine decarboxylase [Candidatus Uhrbacteria bacterium]
MNILLGVTGSVATTLTPQLYEALRAAGHEVQVIATDSAMYFFETEMFPGPITRSEEEQHRIVHVWRDHEERPGKRYVRDQPIPHIELRRWADVLLIAPLSANTLAKLAHGQCDNLLTSVARAWDRMKPIILAPAMNTMMWEHPATAEHLATLQRWYPRCTIIEPVTKRLACGDEGIGAMAPINTIAEAVCALDDPYDVVE